MKEFVDGVEKAISKSGKIDRAHSMFVGPWDSGGGNSWVSKDFFSQQKDSSQLQASQYLIGVCLLALCVIPISSVPAL